MGPEDKIIAALACGRMSGGELADATQLRSGTLYPALMRLEAQGRVVSQWAAGPYPRRRVYDIKGRP